MDNRVELEASFVNGPWDDRYLETVRTMLRAEWKRRDGGKVSEMIVTRKAITGEEVTTVIFHEKGREPLPLIEVVVANGNVVNACVGKAKEG